MRRIQILHNHVLCVVLTLGAAIISVPCTHIRKLREMNCEQTHSLPLSLASSLLTSTCSVTLGRAKKGGSEGLEEEEEEEKKSKWS